MQEEVFGPILPVVVTASLDDSIAFVAARPKPLALYLFTGRSAVEDEVLERTSSGSVRASTGRNGRLPRPGRVRDLQPPPGRAAQADLAGPEAGLPALRALRRTGLPAAAPLTGAQR